MRADFKGYKNAGLPAQVWQDLQEKFENDTLHSYEETLNEFGETEIIIENNDEKVIANEELVKFIDSHFSGDLLKQALVSAIDIRLNEVNYQAPSDNFIGIEAGEYYIPKDVFLKYHDKLSAEQLKHVENHVYRAESFAVWNRNTSNELTNVGLVEAAAVLPTPVAIFNQEFDKENKGIKESKLNEVGLEYLSVISEEERSKMYTLGTLSHEIGHNIFQHLVYKKPHEQEWKDIIDKLGNITEYAKEYDKGNGKDYDENFCEAVRVFTTAREWLDKNGYAEMAGYIEKYFPDIKS
ncbi:MAG: hypothetical protein KGI58_02530 [Patescibacteria group bacterium]|nr:hypothetical protein [Patescibacteria group bacterium]